MRARMAVSVAAVAIVSGLGARGRGFACCGPLRIFSVDVLQDPLDALLVGDRFVEPELELRTAAQVRQPRADLAAEEAGGAVERARRLLARLRVAEARIEHARDLQVGGHLHARKRDEPDARVVHLAAAENLAQHLADLIADAIWPVALSQLRRRHGLHAFHGEDLDEIAGLQVIEALEADAALEARLHLADVVLETAQRANLAFEDDDVVAEQARGRLTGARDRSLGAHAAGNRADLRHLEHLAHFGGADAHLLERRLQEAFHAFLYFLGDLVNARVQADVDLLAFGRVGGGVGGPPVETDDD